MKRAILAAAVCVAGFLVVGSTAQATPIDRLNGVVTSPVQEAQYFWGGRRYCWYPDGWRGPGFYWCGYAWRRGFGWGGPVGWRGWGVGPGPGRFVGRPVGRPFVGRPFVGRPMGRPFVGRPMRGPGGGGFGRGRR